MKGYLYLGVLLTGRLVGDENDMHLLKVFNQGVHVLKSNTATCVILALDRALVRRGAMMRSHNIPVRPHAQRADVRLRSNRGLTQETLVDTYHASGPVRGISVVGTYSIEPSR